MSKSLIPEEKFVADFEPFIKFYAYHVRNKTIAIPLIDIGALGVNLEAKKQRKDIATIDLNALQPNNIYFSSSKKKENVKNLMWCIRCLAAHHPENVEIVVLNGAECYKLWCTHKDNKSKRTVYTMKGLVECNVWSIFINGLIAKIKENEIN